MRGINMNVYFQQTVYEQVKHLIEEREFSRFVNEAVKKELIQKERERKEQIRPVLIISDELQNE
jgi:hypothetical protein